MPGIDPTAAGGPAALDLTDADFAEKLGAAHAAVVDFHAGWCGPCLLFKPKFKRIARDYPHVSFFLVDGEAAPASRKTVQIDQLPFFAAYRDGQLVEGLSTSEESRFRAFVEKHFGPPTAADGLPPSSKAP